MERPDARGVHWRRGGVIYMGVGGGAKPLAAQRERRKMADALFIGVLLDKVVWKCLFCRFFAEYGAFLWPSEITLLE